MNTEEFKMKVIPYAGRIHGIALSFFRSEADAEDVVQEVLLKLWSNQNKLNQIKNLEAFAVSITKNLCIDRMRSYRVKNQSDQLNEVNVESNAELPDEILGESQMKYILKSCIEKLTPREQQVYKLREFDQLEFHEIQSILQIDQTTVRVTLSRARKKVQALFFKKTGYNNE